ncbi:Asp23/Gls24 family envelope stress response protein [Streptomyces asoensis]|uniref:Asp23/Gls24 family envelope stress response protein n=1 Tax=Streptomyces asoensis TaxID=249586 RepID=UPI0033ED4542
MTDRTDPPNGACAHGDDDELLPCGRLLSRVWDDWERQADDTHLRSCPHCRQAVSGLDRLECVVRGLDEETAPPSPQDTESLTRRIMDVVRLELRPGRPVPLGGPAEDLWIMEAVAARTLRAAAETVPGVRAGSCRLLAPDPDGPADEPTTADGSSEGAGAAVGVRLDIHAPAGAPLLPLTERVRERVREAADRELGMPLAAVDIRVTDLVPASAGDGQEGRTP